MPLIEKVSIFITRRQGPARQLLLLAHPSAGTQIPAGTVEPGEAPAAAALREAAEETGLAGLTIRRRLGKWEQTWSPSRRVILAETAVLARPGADSMEWARLARGIQVEQRRVAGPFAQVTYREMDRLPEPRCVTLEITGWVRREVLGYGERRHFFALSGGETSPARWIVRSDGHLFGLFWAPLAALPPIVPPQDAWLPFLDIPPA